MFCEVGGRRLVSNSVHLKGAACATHEQTTQTSFCRFNEIVDRVVLCWSLVGPATPLCPVFERYWPTSGLHDLPRARTRTWSRSDWRSR